MSSNTERKNGYYWVFSLYEWEVAFWDNDYKKWSRWGDKGTYTDNTFTEIDETPITRKEK